jgi:hypothetical protein
MDARGKTTKLGAPAVALALAFVAAIAAPAAAQLGRGTAAPPSASFAPSQGQSAQPRPPAMVPLPAPAAPKQQSPMVPAGQVALIVNARFGPEGPPVGHGVVWRVYPSQPGKDGAFRVIKEDKAPSPIFLLPPGSYVVHAALGLASMAKAVQLRAETVRAVFDIPAGGIRLEGRVGDVRIPPTQITFDIFPGSQFEPGDKRPVAQGVTTSAVTLLPEGTYYIISNYGSGNSVVRSDIRVQAGKLTDVTVTHRAAIITLKLVDKPGGEALANTQWSVLTPGGDVIKESIGAFPRVILAEGEYRAIARNEGKTFEREFKVVTGVDGDIEVLAR